MNLCRHSSQLIMVLTVPPSLSTKGENLRIHRVLRKIISIITITIIIKRRRIVRSYNLLSPRNRLNYKRKKKIQEKLLAICLHRARVAFPLDAAGVRPKYLPVILAFKHPLNQRTVIPTVLHRFPKMHFLLLTQLPDDWLWAKDREGYCLKITLKQYLRGRGEERGYLLFSI